MSARTLLTLSQFERLPEDGMRHELNKGELVSMPPAVFIHSLIQQNLNEAIAAYARQNLLGRVFSEAGFLLSADPPTVRAPDVSYVRAGRLSQFAPERYLDGAPDLAVEVVSPGEDAQELAEKVQQYLGSGAQAVWVVYPKTREVYVHRASGVTVLRDGQSIEAPELLPGWSLPVSGLFRSPASLKS